MSGSRKKQNDYLEPTRPPAGAAVATMAGCGVTAMRWWSALRQNRWFFLSWHPSIKVIPMNSAASPVRSRSCQRACAMVCSTAAMTATNGPKRWSIQGPANALADAMSVVCRRAAASRRSARPFRKENASGEDCAAWSGNASTTAGGDAIFTRAEKRPSSHSTSGSSISLSWKIRFGTAAWTTTAPCCSRGSFVINCYCVTVSAAADVTGRYSGFSTGCNYRTASSEYPCPCHPSHAGVFQFLFFVGGCVDLLEEVDVVSVVELVPVGDGGDRAAAAVGEGGDYALAEVGVEDFADADHLNE